MKTLIDKGWEDAFKEMSENGDDQLLFDDVFENEIVEMSTGNGIERS